MSTTQPTIDTESLYNVRRTIVKGLKIAEMHHDERYLDIFIHCLDELERSGILPAPPMHQAPFILAEDRELDDLAKVYDELCENGYLMSEESLM